LRENVALFNLYSWSNKSNEWYARRLQLLKCPKRRGSPW
jgi:hypothetical protein